MSSGEGSSSLPAGMEARCQSARNAASAISRQPTTLIRPTNANRLGAAPTPGNAARSTGSTAGTGRASATRMLLAARGRERFVGARRAELRLVRDHTTDAPPQIAPPFEELGRRPKIVAPPRPRQGHGQDFFDAARPRPHQHDPVSQEQGLVQTVGDEHDGDAQVLPDTPELQLHELARLGVQRRERLVHEQNLGLERQRPCQPDALLHAARQLVGIAILEVFEADQAQVFAGAVHPLCPGDGLDLQREDDVVEHRAPGQQAEGLKDEGGVRARRSATLTVDDHLPAVWLQQAIHQTQQRRLAAAGLADQTPELAGRHLQRHVAQRFDRRVHLPAPTMKDLRDVAYVYSGRAQGQIIAPEWVPCGGIYLMARPGSSAFGATPMSLSTASTNCVSAQSLASILGASLNVPVSYRKSVLA